MKRVSAGFVVSALLLSSCAHSNLHLNYKKDYDSALLVEPLSIKPLTGGMIVDAIEGTPEHMKELEYHVLFEIHRTLKGEPLMVAAGGKSKSEQAKEALSNHEFIKLATLDFTDPHALVPKEWLSVAVKDPETIGLAEKNFSKQRYKIYLKNVPSRPGSYYVVAIEQKS